MKRKFLVFLALAGPIAVEPLYSMQTSATVDHNQRENQNTLTQSIEPTRLAQGGGVQGGQALQVDASAVNGVSPALAQGNFPQNDTEHQGRPRGRPRKMAAVASHAIKKPLKSDHVREDHPAVNQRRQKKQGSPGQQALMPSVHPRDPMAQGFPNDQHHTDQHALMPSVNPKRLMAQGGGVQGGQALQVDASAVNGVSPALAQGVSNDQHHTDQQALMPSVNPRDPMVHGFPNDQYDLWNKLMLALISEFFTKTPKSKKYRW